MSDARVREKPWRTCLGGCGRRRRTWSRSWRCRFCVVADGQAREKFGSIRELHRVRSGRCVVCGLDPCGCEFGPKVVGLDYTEGGGTT